MEMEPDFCLSTAGENEELAAPRACWVRGRLKDQIHDGHMLIEIKPLLIGQRYGLGCKDVSNLILSSRQDGFSLFPVHEWPCHVYIARILDDAVTKTLTASEAK